MDRIHGWRELPITAIRPDGWLRAFLERQRKGLTGHLEVAGYPFDTDGWKLQSIPRGENTLAGWWPFEQYAYWVDGMIRCGLLLKAPDLIRRARAQIDHVLGHPDGDGYLGPTMLKQISTGDRPSQRWPHAVFFRSVMADHDARPSPRTLKRMLRHYLSGTAPHNCTRNVCNVEEMAWLYARTGNRAVLQEALKSYKEFQELDKSSSARIAPMLTDDRSGDHGPTYMELFKLGAVLYRVTGRRRLLKASVNANRKLVRDHMLADGVLSTTEHLRGVYSTAGHETCVITDYTWSLGYLLMATGSAEYADAIERACLNALPGAVTPDFKALQYFSNPNQVIAGPSSNNHPHGRGWGHMTFRPNPATECCPGNIHRAMPNYAARMWLDDGRGGIVAALYGPSRATVTRGRRRATIVEETNYPFSDVVVFRFECRAPVKMRFSFRIPGWCRRASATINGRALKRKFRPGTFVAVARTFSHGDRLELRLPMDWKIAPGPERGVSVERGPLLYALRISESWRRDPRDARSSSAFPAWNIFPASAWNYALALKRGRRLPPFEVLRRPASDNPWTPETAPCVAMLPARRVPGWRLDRHATLVDHPGGKRRVRRGDFVFTPALPGGAALSRASRKVEYLEFIPMGATCLRLAVLPYVPLG